MKVLFLDIDGVLNSHTQQSNGFCGLEPKCVKNLNKILFAIDDLQIVISSSWRYMITPQSMTLLGFEYMMLIAGIACQGRVLDATPKDEKVSERADQIRYWLNHNADVEKHLALDDMDWQFPLRNIVSLRTNSRVGLTETEADEIIKYFKGEK